ncbi:MAG: hypothetical protein HQL46_07560 [Gammaproteobacteria bacterium]|nr:hypothetical protein [Gammaproteobacteria bacterium]
MNIPANISENLRFLISEVSIQLKNLQIFLSTPSTSLAKHILDRSGYTFNLKSRIQNACTDMIRGQKYSSLLNNQFKALDLIASDLEQIAELSRNCVNLMHDNIFQNSSKNKATLFYKPLNQQIQLINDQLSKLEICIHNNDTKLSMEIAGADSKIKKYQLKLQKKLEHQIGRKKSFNSVMISMSLMNNISHMGNALRSMSEDIISAVLGQNLNTERYQSMRNAIEQRWGLSPEKMDIKTIAETRSGSSISSIQSPKANEQAFANNAIFKDGKKNKLKEEKQRVESWHQIYPGLAPKIIDYHKNGKTASILIEHLSGQTYEGILLHESTSLLKQTQKKLRSTLKKIWNDTYSSEEIPGNYVQQLKKRLDNVFSIHPKFIHGQSSICGYKINAFSTLLDKAEKYEQSYIKAPFSVYIHGDFNIDNIIYDPQQKKINFIDLHRSEQMDYIQDISVFMVSHYRLQALAPDIRCKVQQTAIDFYHFAKKYANKVGDKQFEIRLAIALARSFATSTRFILDPTLSENMFIRAHYLLEKIVNTPVEKINRFHLPIKEVFNGK